MDRSRVLGEAIGELFRVGGMGKMRSRSPTVGQKAVRTDMIHRSFIKLVMLLLWVPKKRGQSQTNP